MICRFCGSSLSEEQKACNNCGEEITISDRLPAEKINAGKAKYSRFKLIAFSVASILLIASIPVIYLLHSIIGVDQVRDIDVDYSYEDYLSAVEKLGFEMNFELQDKEILKEFTASSDKSKVSLYKDYEWIYSDYTEKEFELSENEINALMNEMMPLSFWFDNFQIKIQKDGNLEAAGTLLLANIATDLFPQKKEEIPFPLVKRINYYVISTLSIYENQLRINAEDFKTGKISLVSPDMLQYNSEYLEKIYTFVPELIIHSLEITEQQTIYVEASIPQSLQIRRRTA